MKRRHSSGPSASSFVTADGTPEDQAEHAPTSLKRGVSPPPTNRKKADAPKQKSATAAVEAGEVNVEDHVAFFSHKLSAARLPEVHLQPQLAHTDWLALYQANLCDKGHHFVVHQHDREYLFAFPHKPVSVGRGPHTSTRGCKTSLRREKTCTCSGRPRMPSYSSSS